MEITYNEEQLAVLNEQMAFLKNIRVTLTVATVIIFVVLALGALAIWMSLPLIGVIVCIVSAIPFLVAIGLLRTLIIITRMLKKKTYKVFRVRCSETQRIGESPLWRKVKTTDGIETYFYAKDPIKEINPGEEFDVIIHEKKKVLMFGIFSL